MGKSVEPKDSDTKLWVLKQRRLAEACVLKHRKKNENCKDSKKLLIRSKQKPPLTVEFFLDKKASIFFVFGYCFHESVFSIRCYSFLSFWLVLFLIEILQIIVFSMISFQFLVGWIWFRQLRSSSSLMFFSFCV